MEVVTHDITFNSVADGISACVVEIIDEYEVKYNDKFDYTINKNADEKRKFLLKNKCM